MNSFFESINVDKWHKYFVKERLNELIEASNAIKTNLPYKPVNKSLLGNRTLNSKYSPWVSDNLDLKYYHCQYNTQRKISVSITKEYKDAIKKHEILQKID